MAMQQTAKGNAFASSLIIEDHLKHVVTRVKPVAFKSSTNKLLPRAQHSAFGDFPKTHMPQKACAVETPQPLAAAEMSVANTKMRKYLHPTIRDDTHTFVYVFSRVFISATVLSEEFMSRYWIKS